MSNFDPFAAEWITYAKSPQYALVEKCLKLSQVLEFPNLDIAEYIQKLRSFEQGLREHVSDVKNPIYLVSMLNEYMFDILGFEGDDDDYYNPQNNFLNVVIDKRSGIPITLSIIYIEVARAIGLELKPVGFPGHFLVKYSEELILDPFNRGSLLDIEDLQDILDATFGEGVEFEPEYLNDIEPEKILIRILRNLKGSYTESFNYEKAMHCINMVLGLEPESPEDIRDKGIIQLRLLQKDLALISLNKYLELSPEADDVDDILEMIKSIKEKSNQ
ncbi:MAG: transglutaminase family protein [Thaumarchaeota archaeon]|nr:transglutaminase family protein [Nitrososphaerota archaeon]